MANLTRASRFRGTAPRYHRVTPAVRKCCLPLSIKKWIPLCQTFDGTPLDISVAQLRRLSDDQRRRRGLSEDAEVKEEEVGGEAGGRSVRCRQHVDHSRAKVSVHAQEKGDEVSGLLKAARHEKHERSQNKITRLHLEKKELKKQDEKTHSLGSSDWTTHRYRHNSLYLTLQSVEL